jgi:hypothetical protein
MIDVNEGSKPMKQWPRRFSPDKNVTVKKEIAKLMATRFKRNPPFRLAGQPSFSTEKEHDRVAHVRRLHRSQQTLSKKPVWTTTH